jgi:hypothetical protein
MEEENFKTAVHLLQKSPENHFQRYDEVPTFCSYERILPIAMVRHVMDFAHEVNHACFYDSE